MSDPVTPAQLTPTRLENDFVMLEPLGIEHTQALQAAAADGELWRLWFTSVPTPEATAAYIKTAMQNVADGHTLAFAVRDRRGERIVGCTRLFHFDRAVPRLEIGHTWYAASYQRTHVNPACKRLLLGYAFESLGCAAVAFCTDDGNAPSQRAIERLGAKREGVLRAHMRRADHSLRDTVAYSIIASEWPHVRATLDARLQQFAAAGS